MVVSFPFKGDVGGKGYQRRAWKQRKENGAAWEAAPSMVKLRGEGAGLLLGFLAAPTDQKSQRAQAKAQQADLARLGY